MSTHHNQAEAYGRAMAKAAIAQRREQIASGRPCSGCYGHKHGKQQENCYCCANLADDGKGGDPR